MSDELAAWLRLREGADWDARSARLAAQAGAQASRPGAVLEVLDLGTGTGSNLRYLAPRLGAAHQRWTVVDHSDVVLRHLVARTIEWAVGRGLTAGVTAEGCEVAGPAGERFEVRTFARDLHDVDATLLAGRHLVTASALLDLVSDPWLQRLAGHCAAARVPALFALTYDGRFTCEPPDDDDAAVRTHFNRHQHTDKGLGGPAAGPDATACAIARFVEAGFAVETVQTDWVIGPDAVDLQRALIAGWAFAASETAPGLAVSIDEWKGRRLGHVEEGTSHLRVGHHDLLAVPR